MGVGERPVHCTGECAAPIGLEVQCTRGDFYAFLIMKWVIDIDFSDRMWYSWSIEVDCLPGHRCPEKSVVLTQLYPEMLKVH